MKYPLYGYNLEGLWITSGENAHSEENAFDHEQNERKKQTKNREKEKEGQAARECEGGSMRDNE